MILTKSKLQLFLVIFLLFFSLFHGIHILFFGFSEISPAINNSPMIYIISRDFIFIFFIIINLMIQRINLSKLQLDLLGLSLFIFLIVSLRIIDITVDNLQNGYRNLLMYMSLLFLIPSLNFDVKDINKIFSYFINFVFLASLLLILTLLEDSLTWSSRPFGTLFSPNTAGTILAFALSLIRYEGIKNMIIFYTILLALFLTASLGGIITYFLFIIIYKRNFFLKIMTIFFMLLIVNQIKSIIIFNEVFFKLNIFLFNSDNLHSYTNRITQYQDAVHNISNQSIFYSFFGNFNLDYYFTSDSFYLQLFHNHGLFVVATYLILFLYLIFYIKKNISFYLKVSNNEHSICAYYLYNLVNFSIVFLIVNCSVTASLYHYPINLIFYLFLGLAILFIKIKNKNE